MVLRYMQPPPAILAFEQIIRDGIAHVGTSAAPWCGALMRPGCARACLGKIRFDEQRLPDVLDESGRNGTPIARVKARLRVPHQEKLSVTQPPAFVPVRQPSLLRVAPGAAIEDMVHNERIR